MSRHNFDYVSTDPQDVKTFVSRTEATQVLVLDSRNRNFNSQTRSSNNSVNIQPWNNFRLQRPQALMQSYATRVAVTEVRFPWYIPNISALNNILYITNGAGDSVKITLPPGYYTPAQIVTAVNQQIAASTLSGIATLSYDDNTSTYTFTQGPDPWGLFFTDPDVSNSINHPLYESSANLCKTLGFTFFQSNGSNIGEGGYFSFTGNSTESLYTHYVDIVSEKLNYYSDQKDGSSDPATSQALLCRLYLADEISMAQNEGSFFQPFLIHRQFKTPKTVMWNKDAVVDWLDIAVYDEYGQLIPLPQLYQFDNSGETPVFRTSETGSYPNFQITLLATEN